MTWPVVSGHIKGSTLVIFTALVWVSGLQPRGEMCFLKMKTSFSCRKCSNTSCFLTVLQPVRLLPCHPIWRTMASEEHTKKAGWELKDLTGVGNTLPDSHLHFLGARGELDLWMLCMSAPVTDPRVQVSPVHEQQPCHCWFRLSTWWDEGWNSSFLCCLKKAPPQGSRCNDSSWTQDL